MVSAFGMCLWAPTVSIDCMNVLLYSATINNTNVLVVVVVVSSCVAVGRIPTAWQVSTNAKHWWVVRSDGGFHL